MRLLWNFAKFFGRPERETWIDGGQNEVRAKEMRQCWDTRCSLVTTCCLYRYYMTTKTTKQNTLTKQSVSGITSMRRAKMTAFKSVISIVPPTLSCFTSHSIGTDKVRTEIHRSNSLKNNTVMTKALRQDVSCLYQHSSEPAECHVNWLGCSEPNL